MAAAARAGAALLLISFVAHVAAFTGDLTYYGDNGWAGWCAGNVPNEGKPWPPPGGQFGQRVALNGQQFSSASCGRKIRFRGTGSGSGMTRPSGEWQNGQVTNLCPECPYGDIDLGKSGDGRWGVEWEWVDGSGSGGNSVQSSSSSRAVVSKGPKPTYNWRAFLAKKRAKGKSGPKPTYNWRAFLAKKRAKKGGKRPTYNWRRFLAKKRAKKGRKLLHAAARA